MNEDQNRSGLGLFEHLSAMVAAYERDFVEQYSDQTPLERLAREFLANSWAAARDGLLAKSQILEVAPEFSPAPRAFRFCVDRPYKRKTSGGRVELVPGPIRGTIYYRADLFAATDEQIPTVAVELDDRDYYHPNFSRRHGQLCLGALPPEPLPLDRLLEHLYRILCYASGAVRVTHPADIEAAVYFATDPAAFAGLEDAPPLY